MVRNDITPLMLSIDIFIGYESILLEACLKLYIDKLIFCRMVDEFTAHYLFCNELYQAFISYLLSDYQLFQIELDTIVKVMIVHYDFHAVPDTDQLSYTYFH